MQFEPGDRRRQLPRHLRRPEPEQVFDFRIRPAEASDLPHVREIYNHYVRNSVVTLDESTSGNRYWRDRLLLVQRLGLPFLVAVSPSEQVIGFALAQPWAGRNSHRYTAEESIYLGPGAGGKGLGTALLSAVVEACRERGLRELIAVISDSGADASIRLHERLGFVEAGRMGTSGVKYGRSLGTVQMRLALKPEKRRGLLRRD